MANRNSEGREVTVGTAAFYDKHAVEYFGQTVAADMLSVAKAFSKLLPQSARILDVGCGSGRDLLFFRQTGFRPTGIDVSSVLADLAARYSGVSCSVVDVRDIECVEEFDAVWACASLLHLPKRDLPRALARIRRALLPGGKLFVSIQLGIGETELPDGRWMSYFEADEFDRILRASSFQIDMSWRSADALSRPVSWSNIFAHR